MRLAHLVASLLTILATPALADEGRLALVAKLAAGLVDGGQMTQGSLGAGDIRQLDAGAYEVTFKTATMKYLFDEPDTCIFTQHAQLGDDASEARFHFDKVTSIDVRAQGKFDGLNATLLTFNGPDGVIEVMMGDKLVPQVPAFAFLLTSMTTEEFQAAADEIQRVC